MFRSLQSSLRDLELRRFRLPPVWRHIYRRQSAVAADRAAVETHLWRSVDDKWPHGLSLQWLGTAGFRLTYDGCSLYIDPYFSRLSLRQLIETRNGRLNPIESRVEAHLEPAAAVLVGHTHYDHALDVPLICSRLQCPAYGSRSLARLMTLHDLGDQAIAVKSYEPFEIGPFKVTFVPSEHVRLVMGLAVWPGGEISCSTVDRLSLEEYRCGQVFAVHVEVAGISFYHQGSAELLDDAVRHQGVDVFLAPIVGRTFSDRFVSRAIRHLRPKYIVPHHYDDMFCPVDEDPGFLFGVDLDGFVKEVRREDRAPEIRTMKPLMQISSRA